MYRYKYIYNEICDSYYYQDYKRITPPPSAVCSGTFSNMISGCVKSSTVEYTGRGYLFDLIEDPYESTDLSDELPEVAEAMHVRVRLISSTF
jgi:hypothetical protein